MLISNNLVFAEPGELWVTSDFGWRIDPVTNRGNNQHKGIDLVLWVGHSSLATVCAFADGVVTEAVDEIEGVDYINQRGNYVTIDHGNGWVTKYYHLWHNTVKVKVGDKVTARQPIGYMGSTGYSTGAHLHFQMELNGEPQDPKPYLTGEKKLITEDSKPKQDNEPSDWAREAVEWAKANGIIYGNENGDLMLKEPCTREMMLVFLYRARGK